MTRADLAVAYAKRDWFPFPCQIMSKKPATRSGFMAGTNDIVTTRQRWRTTEWNIGIWTGASRLAVIDLDIKPERGDPGISWFLVACDAVGFDMESTYCVNTPSGGVHVLFETDNLYPPSVGSMAPNVDTRCGGSYVLAHGSELENGVYEHFGSDIVQLMPDWLDVLLDPVPVVKNSPLRQLAYDNRDDGFDRALDGLLTVARNSIQGERNNTINWVAWKIGQHYWTEQQREFAIERLKLVAVEIGVDDDKPGQTEATIRSQQRLWPPAR